MTKPHRNNFTGKTNGRYATIETHNTLPELIANKIGQPAETPIMVAAIHFSLDAAFQPNVHDCSHPTPTATTPAISAITNNSQTMSRGGAGNATSRAAAGATAGTGKM
jgi:hypothetical protein